jgi:hypothetical protein
MPPMSEGEEGDEEPAVAFELLGHGELLCWGVWAEILSGGCS